jgi:hypothetical protein
MSPVRTRQERFGSSSLEIDRRLLGPEHSNTLFSVNNLVGVYYTQCKYALAEASFSQAVDIERRVLGPENPQSC